LDYCKTFLHECVRYFDTLQLENIILPAKRFPSDKMKTKDRHENRLARIGILTWRRVTTEVKVDK
jgi:hypothetical protein